MIDEVSIEIDIFELKLRVLDIVEHTTFNPFSFCHSKGLTNRHLREKLTCSVDVVYSGETCADAWIEKEVRKCHANYESIGDLNTSNVFCSTE